jgi:peptide/nickel transport system substrate-binding protein
LILQARAELDSAKRVELYGQLAAKLNEEGGVIVPMFNNFIDAYSNSVAGYLGDPDHEVMGGRAASLTWFA